MGNASFQNFEVAHQIVNDAKTYLESEMMTASKLELLFNIIQVASLLSLMTAH